jgi:hypothetical protein
MQIPVRHLRCAAMPLRKREEKTMAHMHLPRREFLMAGSALGLLSLAGCQSAPELSLTEAIRRLLTLASQNAFADLIRENGFLSSQIAKLQVPEFLGGSDVSLIAGLLLNSRPVQDRLLRVVNRAAEKGADLAAPIVAETVRNMSIADALSIVRGGPSAATDLLQSQLGDALIGRMLPGVEGGLRLFDNEIISQVISKVANVDLTRIVGDVAGKANSAIFRAIAAQEANIRANPAATNDPLLIAVFGLR